MDYTAKVLGNKDGQSTQPVLFGYFEVGSILIWHRAMMLFVLYHMYTKDKIDPDHSFI